MSGDVMNFPNTWEEYEEYYGFNDTEQVYTNGSRLIQSFRVKQWLEHIEVSEDCENCKHENEPRFGTICGSCTKANSENFEPIVSEDAISREWAINKQKELIELYTPHKTVEGRGQVYWQIEERI